MKSTHLSRARDAGIAQRSIRSWCESRSHRKSEQTKILPRMRHRQQLDHDGGRARLSLGKAQKSSPHTIRNVSTNETCGLLSLVWACSLPTPPEDLAFHREPLTAAFDLHGLSTSHEWSSPHVRGGGEETASSGLELPSLSARLRLCSIRSSPASTTRHGPVSLRFCSFSFSFCHTSRDDMPSAMMRISELSPQVKRLTTSRPGCCSDPSQP